MKKQKVYTPLFEIEDLTTEKAACLCCGKSVKKTLVNQNGICVECIMNNKINSNNACLIPNEKLFSSFFNQYKKHLKTKPKNNVLIGAAGATFGLLSAAIISIAASDSQSPNTNSKFNFVNKKIKPSSFEKCNKMTLTIRDESWVCPCCNNDNSGAHFCKVCGVYPKFKLED